MAYTTQDIRNVALFGQASAGKTMLCEAMLFAAGAISTKGEIERKNTTSDQDVLEKQHQRSLSSSVLSFEHKKSHINIIDTPGYSDFIGPAISVINAVETAIITINAQNGVETMTRRFVEWAKEANVNIAIVINKIDLSDINLEQIYAEIQEELGIECLAVNLPAENSQSVTSCLYPNGSDVKADFTSIDDAHVAIADQIAEIDEELMEEYLDTGELPEKKIAPAFKQAMREGHLIPIVFTSASTDVGVSELLDMIVELFPNPQEGNLPVFSLTTDDGEQQFDFAANSNADFLGHIFKISFDPFLGKLGVFRIYQGQMDRDTAIYVDGSRKPVKFNNLYSLLGKQYSDISGGVAGDICGIAKIDELMQASILITKSVDHPMCMKSVIPPQPMVGLAISSTKRGDEQKVVEALQKIAIEDPCVRLDRNAAANETILRGLGDLHLRVALERIKETYNVEVTTSVPTVEYRETVVKSSEGHCRHKKQTGGAGQFGEVFLRVEPLNRGDGFEFVDNVVGGSIPSQFIPAVEKGIHQVLESGAFAGFPLQDVRVIVHDGKHHPVDSKEIAFISAGKKAFIDAVTKANPIVLEPIADVTITVPSAFMGDIAGELSARRGRIKDTDSLPSGVVNITGSAPLAEMSDFQAKLNAITGGEGSFIMQFSTYDPAPSEVQKKLSAQFQQPDED